MDSEGKGRRTNDSATVDSLPAETDAREKRPAVTQHHPRVRALIRRYGGKVQFGEKR